MARLSNSTRASMAVALVKHRFAAEAAALIAESQELFRKLYDDHYDAATRQHMAAIGKKYKSAFSKASELTANVNGRQIKVGNVTLGYRDVNWKIEVAARPILQDQTGYRDSIGLPADHPLSEALVSFDDRRNALREQIDPARREALGALQQFTTGKKLGEEWPEAMPVIGALIPEDDRTLPVVQVAHLNSKFDLPPSERLAA